MRSCPDTHHHWPGVEAFAGAQIRCVHAVSHGHLGSLRVQLVSDCVQASAAMHPAAIHPYMYSQHTAVISKGPFKPTCYNVHMISLIQLHEINIFIHGT